MPRSLKLPVWLLPHSLTHRSGTPICLPRRSAQKRLVLPSYMLTTFSSRRLGHHPLAHAPDAAAVGPLAGADAAARSASSTRAARAVRAGRPRRGAPRAGRRRWGRCRSPRRPSTRRGSRGSSGSGRDRASRLVVRWSIAALATMLTPRVLLVQGGRQTAQFRRQSPSHYGRSGDSARYLLWVKLERIHIAYHMPESTI